MKKWHSLFEILRFPIEIVFFATIMLGIGNLLHNEALGIAYLVDIDAVRTLASIFSRVGGFLIVNFPLLFLVRLVSRRNGSAVTILSGVMGYVMFLVATMFTNASGLPGVAYSAILGLSMTSSSANALSTSTQYPLQTGMLGAAAVAIITLISYSTSRKKNEYGLFSFISKDMACVMRTVFFSLLAGIAFNYGWPYVIRFISKVVSFITVDTTNPINLTLYGILDRMAGVLNLGALIRQPFWFTANGGSWVGVSGAAVTGDAAIWTAQLSTGSFSGMAGRFFTPYYVLNLFAIPGMIWAMFSLETNPLERRRVRMFGILATLASLFCGSMLPIELMLAYLCPLLLLFHAGMSGILFGLLQALHIYLGFNTGTVSTLTAQPGTLPELVSYVSNPALQMNIVWICVIGIVTSLLYFLATRAYFRYFAMDFFNTGDTKRAVASTLKAVGGIENIKLTQSSVTSLTIAVYDPTKVDVERLRRLGAIRVYETRAGFALYYGAASTMIRMGIENVMRAEIREQAD